MRTRAEEWDCGCYYRFHYDYGHDTEECYDLKNQIEDLICRGHLDRYIRKPREPSLRPKGPVERQVYVIIGGPTVGGDNSSARKAYAHAEVQRKPQARDGPGITFKSENLIPMTSTLTGFTVDTITSVGVATLPITFDDEPRTKTFMIPFMVVELSSAYNVIIGHPTLNKLRAIVSTYHRNMKFQTSVGQGESGATHRSQGDAT
ncbi:hypothetical protein B296_00045812 [Ensete ventricosum]|uniref:Uncharacterized protein n=1 Tax=Ensete ventricosum TaxID=4639 RepID=A0A426YN77_ENSVE|nr:hypothetical protein B296_00045812 [Ensete ventricosum]